MRIAKLNEDQSDTAGLLLAIAFHSNDSPVEVALYGDMDPTDATALQEATWKQTMYRAVRERECYASYVDLGEGKEAMGSVIAYTLPAEAHVSSLWSENGGLPTPYDDEVQRLMPADVLDAWKELGTHLAELKARSYENTDHYTLSPLGTPPSSRGKGLAGALVRLVVDKAKADGKEVCLSTDTEQNVKFYSAFGFRIIGTSKFTVRGVPLTWYCMSTAMFGKS